MNRNATVLSLLGGLVLGAATLGAAQGNAFNPKRAKLENERNTVSVVRQTGDGLVLITATSKPAAKPAAAPKQKAPEAQPKPGQPKPEQPKAAPAQPKQDQAPGSQAPQNDPQGQMEDMMRRFFGGQVPQEELEKFFGQGPGARPSASTGSGFFVNDAGYILTNHHVVDGADTIKVRLHHNKKQYPAKVVGTAPDYDLALIKAEVPRELVKPMPLADSSSLEVGQKAIALGAPFGLDFSVTEGIVSAVGRQVPLGERSVPQRAIQTDAAINPGNSGGPLLNSDGEVIGVNTMIISPGSIGGGQFAGVGFAIPINVAKNLLPKLQAGGQLETPRIGVQYMDLEILDDDTRAQLKLPASGLLVQEVLSGSPAAKAGLRSSKARQTVGEQSYPTGGDIITEVDGKSILDEDMRAVLLGKSYGEIVRLTVIRDGKKLQVAVKLFKAEDKG